jgi:polysaccharide export outer membrane protein
VDLLRVNGRDGHLQLDDGSVVMVVQQPRRTVQVIGLVQQPTEIEMPVDRNMRLLDAIAQAGGLTIQVANKVRIIRHVPGESEPVVIQTSLRDAKRRGHANVLLAAGDVVSVEETPATFTVEMLRSFIRFGFTSSIPGM